MISLTPEHSPIRFCLVFTLAVTIRISQARKLRSTEVSQTGLDVSVPGPEFSAEGTLKLSPPFVNL